MGRLDRKTRFYPISPTCLLGISHRRTYRRVAEVHFDAGYVPARQSLDAFTPGLPLHRPSRSSAVPMHEISLARLLAQLFEVTEQFEMETQPQAPPAAEDHAWWPRGGRAHPRGPTVNMWALRPTAHRGVDAGETAAWRHALPGTPAGRQSPGPLEAALPALGAETWRRRRAGGSQPMACAWIPRPWAALGRGAGVAAWTPAAALDRRPGLAGDSGGDVVVGGFYSVSLSWGSLVTLHNPGTLLVIFRRASAPAYWGSWWTLHNPAHPAHYFPGGIAAYKEPGSDPPPARARGGACAAILTAGAQQFVTPLSVSALSGQKVLHRTSSPSPRRARWGICAWAREADLVLVAPATADLLAKMALGLGRRSRLGDLAGGATGRWLVATGHEYADVGERRHAPPNLALLEKRGQCAASGPNGRRPSPRARSVLGPCSPSPWRSWRRWRRSSSPTPRLRGKARPGHQRTDPRGDRSRAPTSPIIPRGSRVTPSAAALAPPRRREPCWWRGSRRGRPRSARASAVVHVVSARGDAERLRGGAAGGCGGSAAAAVADWARSDAAAQKLKKQKGCHAPASSWRRTRIFSRTLSERRQSPARGLMVGFAAENGKI